MKPDGLELLKRRIARLAAQLLASHGLAPRRKRRPQTSALFEDGLRISRPERPLRGGEPAAIHRAERNRQMEPATGPASPSSACGSLGQAPPGNGAGEAPAERYPPPQFTPACRAGSPSTCWRWRPDANT